MTSSPLILEVLWGPGQGRKAVVSVGQRLTIGSAGAAGWCLDCDPGLAAVHLELHWNGETAEVRAVADASLQIDGYPSSAGRSGHGGWLRVAATDLALAVQRSTPPDRELTPDLRAFTAPVLTQLTALAALPGPRFALLDTVRSPRIHTLLRESPAPWRSLYDGPQGDALAEAAPALVDLGGDPQLAEDLVHEGWGERWGLFLAAPPGRDIEAVRRHLRKFLRVQVDQSAMYFRFYDPRVFATFVPTCTPEERRELLADITWYVIDERAVRLVAFTA